MKPSPGTHTASGRMPRTRHIPAADARLAALALAGFVVGLLPDTIVSFYPVATGILRQSWVLFLEIPACFIIIAALALWARRNSTRRRWAFSATVFATGTLAALFQALAVAAGWWQGSAYSVPWLALALAGHRGAVSLAAHLGLILVGYHLLSSRRPRLALLLYGLVMLIVIPGSIAGDIVAINGGEYTYRNGFSIGADILYGEALFAAQLLIYEALRRRAWRTEP